MRMSLDCGYLIPEPDIVSNSKNQEEFRNTATTIKVSLSTLRGCGHPKIKMSVLFYLIISQIFGYGTLQVCIEYLWTFLSSIVRSLEIVLENVIYIMSV